MKQKQSRETDTCTALKTLYTLYSIQQAAALWCGVPEGQVEEIIQGATTLSDCGLGICTWKHSDVPDLEYKSRAIAIALDNDSLPYLRDDYTPPYAYEPLELRKIPGRYLKEWIEKEFPNEKPEFLFSDPERDTYAINSKAYQTLKAENDHLKQQNKEVNIDNTSLQEENKALRDECKLLKEASLQAGVLDENSETTYFRIIAVLLRYIKGDMQGVEQHPSYSSEDQLMEAILANFSGIDGISKRTFQRKFPEAKRSLPSQ